MGVGANQYGFTPVHVDDQHLIYLKAAASQTWVKGDMLYLNSGEVTLATASSATLLGAAADDRTDTTAGDLVPVWAKINQIFRCRADADPSSLVTGAEIDIVGGSGEMEADIGASTTDVLVFLKQQSEQANEAGAFIEVIINQSKHDLNQ